MERVKITVSKRQDTGKEKIKRLRNQGFVPAVVYSEDTNIALTIPVSSLKILRAIHFSESTVIDMEIKNGKKQKPLPVLIKEVQFHPVTEAIFHIDFLKVSLTNKIKVNIPLVLKGESKAVKEEEGAVLEQILRDLEIEGLPLDIPEKIEVDISELGIGKSLHVEDLSIADNLKIITDPQATIVIVGLKKEEEVEEVPLEGEAAPTEPEVIKEKKEASEEEGKEGKEVKEAKKEAKEDKK